MSKTYSEDEKIKFIQGFRSSNIPIIEYCNAMKIECKELNKWMREYKKIPKFGMIELGSKEDTTIADVETEATIGMKFESKGIKIELADNYDKNFLIKIMEVIVTC